MTGFKGEHMVVRLFPGWAQSPLWLPGGPISFEESHLTPELVADIRAWESPFYTSGLSEVSASVGQNVGEGIALAKRIAAELGSGFTVVVDAEHSKNESLHVDEPASNTAARRAFLQMFEEEAM